MHNNFMVDVETTGLIGHRNHITSLAIVQFGLEDRKAYALDSYNVRLFRNRIDRVEDADTMKFRNEHFIEAAEKGIKRQIYPIGFKAEFLNINQWIRDRLQDGTHPVMWAHHDLFDFSFLHSYYRDADIIPAWSHRDIIDLDSYIYGLTNKTYGPIADKVEFEGQAHLALDDCKYQIKVLDRALKFYSLRGNTK